VKPEQPNEVILMTAALAGAPSVDAPRLTGRKGRGREHAVTGALNLGRASESVAAAASSSGAMM
jgi:hypothetical protein